MLEKTLPLATLEQVNARLSDPTDAVGRLMTATHFLEVQHRRVRRLHAEERGVSATEFNVILLLVELGNLTPKQLGHDLGLTAGAMTAVIDRLESTGRVSRIPNPRDRRSLLVCISDSCALEVQLFYVNYFEALAAAVAESEELGSAEFANNLNTVTKVIRTIADWNEQDNARARDQKRALRSSAAQLLASPHALTPTR